MMWENKRNLSGEELVAVVGAIERFVNADRYPTLDVVLAMLGIEKTPDPECDD